MRPYNLDYIGRIDTQIINQLLMLRGISFMNKDLAKKVENNLDNILQQEFGQTYEEFVANGQKDKMTAEDFFGPGFLNLWNKITGNALTDADKQANEFSSQQADLAFQRQKEFYQEFQSPEAQMKSQMAGMQSLGVNPALMYGGSMPSGGGSSSPAAPSSVSPSSGESLGSLISVMLNAAKVGAEIKNINADTRLKDTSASRNESETTGIDIANWIKKQTAGFEVVSAELKNEETRKRIDNIVADSSLKGSQLIVNGKQVDYLASQIELNGSIVAVNDSTIAKQTQEILESKERVSEIASKIRLNNANSANIEAITPYMSEYYDSLIALQDARTEEAQEHASLLIASTSQKVLEVAKDKKLLDEGYYDDLIDAMHFKADTAAYESVEAAVSAKNAPSATALANGSAVVQMLSAIIGSFAGAGIGYRQFKGKPRANRTTSYDANGRVRGVTLSEDSSIFQ